MNTLRPSLPSPDSSLNHCGDIYTTFYPVYLLSKCLGLASFNVKGPIGDRTFVKTKCRLFCYVVLASSTLAGILIISTIIDSMFAPDTFALVLYTRTFLTLFGLIQSCTLIINKVAQEEVLERTWRRIIEGDEELMGLGITIDNRSSRWFCTMEIAVTMTLLLSHYCFVTTYYDESLKIHVLWFLSLVGNIYKACVRTEFQTWLLLMKQRFELVGGKIFMQTGKDRLQLEKLLVCHQRLSTTLKMITKMYSVPVLVDFGMDFCMFTVHIYDLCKIHAANVFGLTLTSAFWLTYYAHELFGVIVCCGYFTQHANAVKRKLIQIVSNVQDNAIRKEINAFALQLLHYEIKITAGGFFKIDFPLIYTIIGAITTYLIILIQFDIALSRN